MEEISILRMFADYLPTEEMRNALAGAIIDNADLDPEKGSAVVYAHGARYIPACWSGQVGKSGRFMV